MQSKPKTHCQCYDVDYLQLYLTEKANTLFNNSNSYTFDIVVDIFDSDTLKFNICIKYNDHFACYKLCLGSLDLFEIDDISDWFLIEHKKKFILGLYD